MSQIIINIGTSPNDGTGNPLRVAMDAINQNFTELYTKKVDKVVGKGLSANDFTTPLLTKLSGIQAGAEVNVQSDLSQNDDTQDDFVKNKAAFFNPDPVLFTAASAGTGKTFSPVTFQAGTVLKSKGELFKGTEWTQSGDTITILVNVNLGNTIYIKP